MILTSNSYSHREVNGKDLTKYEISRRVRSVISFNNDVILPPATMNGVQIRSRLSELTQLEDYDDDFQEPSSLAIRMVEELLSATVAELKRHLPKGYIYPDGNGGIGIEWNNRTAKLSILVPGQAERPASLYYRWNEKEYGTDSIVSPHSLSVYLNKLNQNDRS